MRKSIAPIAIAATLAFCLAFNADSANQINTATAENATLADSLMSYGEYDSARVLIRTTLTDARAENDSVLLARVLALAGIAEVNGGDQSEALAYLNESIGMAQAQRDTVTWMRALGGKGNAFRNMGERGDARNAHGRALELALATRNRTSEGWARNAIAGLEWREGNLESALRESRSAAAAFRSVQHPQGELAAMSRIGPLYFTMGKVDTARTAMLQQLARSQELGIPSEEALVIGDLGVLEANAGDMTRAVQYFRRAYEYEQSKGNIRQSIMPANNLGNALAQLGRYEEAESILNKTIDMCETNGFTAFTGQLLASSANVLQQQERWDAAASQSRRALALGSALRPKARSTAKVRLAASMLAMDSTQTAIAVLQDQKSGGESATLLAKSYRRQNQLDDALTSALEAEESTRDGKVLRYRVDALFELSMCYAARGESDEALHWFNEGVQAARAHREQQSTHAWREVFGGARALVTSARVVLDHPPNADYHERVEALYDVLQTFKARTLIERITEPRERSDPRSAFAELDPVTLEELQTTILQPRELLLDFVVGENETYLFAVTRDSCRIALLPGYASDFPEQITIYHDAMGASTGASRTRLDGLQRSSAELGLRILGEFDDLIRSADRVVVAPDSYFNALPFGTLALSSNNEPLFETKAISRVPSATLLRLLRRPEKPPTDAIRFAALVPESSTELRGAKEEVRFLESTFEGVTVMAGLVGNAQVNEALSASDIVHIAGHVEVDDEVPWRSGILLGRRTASTSVSATRGSPGDEDGASRGAAEDDPYLRAARIAGWSIPARLTVLSGCESALGRITRGEGVLGLTSAFLSAGVKTVIATLWEVDDRVTADLMKTFYDQLAKGETAEAALRIAQLRIRSDSATESPFYWAGFVVVGDGTTTVPLVERPRGNRLPWVGMVGGLLIVGALGLRARGRASRKRTPG